MNELILKRVVTQFYGVSDLSKYLQDTFILAKAQ